MVGLVLGWQTRERFSCWRRAVGVELFVGLSPRLIREQVEAAWHWMPAKSAHQATEWGMNCVLAVEHRWHRYSGRMVMNRRVSSVRESSLDGCGDSAWSRIK